MNLQIGENKKYVFCDIKEGTLVAFVIKYKDKNIKNPLGRVLIKPYFSEETKQVYYNVSAVVYGDNIFNFKDKLSALFSYIQKNKFGIFILDKRLYNWEIPLIVKNPQEIYKKDLDKLDYEGFLILFEYSEDIKELSNMLIEKNVKIKLNYRAIITILDFMRINDKNTNRIKQMLDLIKSNIIDFNKSLFLFNSIDLLRMYEKVRISGEENINKLPKDNILRIISQLRYSDLVELIHFNAFLKQELPNFKKLFKYKKDQ